ncbi:ABC transporter substrate-binding protein [Halalkalibacter akibai]|uniref:N-acetyl-D-glucosamine ABC transport system n=1 Tax=Halalkalibacter akibai (strain ATCC 43226 / DSM 21942 / CIP 109018 / JCM 9157 / 1139) TaxID=1236973 RepID=W4QPG7_HALA3|nr:sugar ABC transporter substrate-binding protein [Halalkalibacter akibai]GAE33951.1 N-acetyl-D-glucosamine ABC transport system [Halalkalibacter akibai JCM 9157]
MSKTKWFKGFLLLLVMSIALFGCSNGQSSSGSSNSDSSDSGSKGPITLTVNLWAQPHEEEIYKTIIDEFEEEYPHVTVDFVVTPGDDYSTRLQTLMAGNRTPDIFYLGAGDANFYVDTGRVLDITEMVEASEVFDIDAIWESGISRYTIDDRIYAMPKDVGPFAYAYNKELFDAAGVEYPDSHNPYDWNEFTEVAKQLTIDKNGNNAAHPDFDARNVEQFGAGFWWIEPAVYSNGAHWLNEDATEITIDTPEFIEALQYVADLRLVHGVVPSQEQEQSSNSYSRWLNGGVAMFPMGPWDQAAFWELDFDYDLQHWPKSPRTGESITWLGSLGFAVSADTKHPEEAFALASYLAIDEDAQRNLMERGATIPNIIEMAEEEYLNADFKPESKHVFLDIIKGQSQPLPAELTYDGEWYDYFLQTVVDVWEGRKTAEQYVQEVKPKLQELLDESNAKAERARANN